MGSYMPCSEAMAYKPNEPELPFTDAYDLSTIPNLTVLSWVVDLDSIFNSDPLTGLCDLMCASPSGKNKIKTIVLQLSGMLKHPWSLTACLDKPFWHPFNAVLAKTAHREELVAKFRLDIYLNDFLKYAAGELSTEVRERLEEEMGHWTTKNLENMKSLSSNVSLEYEYSFIGR
ncbi:hypothetical protein GALMADRAFT_559611 [Galerina marginata CBS 339.88]|uniref:Uncharacterized protein n=1 Tax=Galerina marginata (strain CBS 339.88) TaxID=685588 RepID=A0A067T6K9_GALM3|nr:hypothetical protein GALMADRAFT_559611 [Galerina marginata CBS 339.88]